MTKRLTFTGSTLRPRSDEDKGQIAQALIEHVVPLMEQGRCTPVIHSVFPMPEAQKAHELMESSTHIGKIALRIKRSEEHTSELQSLMSISYDVFSLKKNT